MSYTPPSLLDFAFSGGAYTPPEGGALFLNFYDELILNATGGVLFAGDISFLHGTKIVFNGEVSLGGGVVVAFDCVFQGSGRNTFGGNGELSAAPTFLGAGELWLGGVASLLAPPTMIGSGRVVTGGSGNIVSGGSVSCMGKFSLTGRANLSVGRVFSAVGAMSRFAGIVQLIHGRAMIGEGGYTFSGGADLQAYPLHSLALAGALNFYGLAEITTPHSFNAEQKAVFITSRQDRLEVFH